MFTDATDSPSRAKDLIRLETGPLLVLNDFFVLVYGLVPVVLPWLSPCLVRVQQRPPPLWRRAAGMLYGRHTQGTSDSVVQERAIFIG